MNETHTRRLQEACERSEWDLDAVTRYIRELDRRGTLEGMWWTVWGETSRYSDFVRTPPRRPDGIREVDKSELVGRHRFDLGPLVVSVESTGNYVKKHNAQMRYPGRVIPWRVPKCFVKEYNGKPHLLLTADQAGMCVPSHEPMPGMRAGIWLDIYDVSSLMNVPMEVIGECPACDGAGNLTAKGRRSVFCKSCRQSGWRVIPDHPLLRELRIDMDKPSRGRAP